MKEMNRREFLTLTGASVALLALAACGAPSTPVAPTGKEAELVEMLIAMRQDARKNKNYALADELRNKLNEIGIVLQDTPQGVKWSKQ